jgi:hypothetical protein
MSRFNFPDKRDLGAAGAEKLGAKQISRAGEHKPLAEPKGG